MTMATNYVEVIEAAMRDGQELVPWTADNAVALQWEPLDEAVRRALASPVPSDLAMGIPLLMFANGREALPLVQAVMNPPIPSGGRRWLTCDVYGTGMREPNTLWVPCGSSVVQVTMRNFAREVLQDATRCSLVWC